MKINSLRLLTIFLTCLLFLISILLSSKNYLLLGSEGNYFTDFKLIRAVGSSAWVSINAGTGAPNPTLNGLTAIFDFFSLLQTLDVPLKLINATLAFLVYSLPFLCMMWMLYKIMKVDFFTSYILSLFYALNPFSTYHLQGLMFWNTAPLFVLPIIFVCLYKFYFEKFKLFFAFGLLTALFAFSLSNIPYLGIFHIFLFISIIIIPYIHNVKWDLKIVLRNLFITELSFVLFNAWWFINLLRFQMQDLKNYYTTEFAVSWAISAAGNSGIMGRIFSLKTLVTTEKNTFFSDFYNSFPMNMILFIPFCLIIWNLFKETGEKENRRTMGTILLVGFILAVIFLNKGVHKPFFIIFKSPLEKFSVLLIFLLTIGLLQVFKNTKHTWPYYLLIVYVMANSIPHITLNLFPEYKFEADSKYITKLYRDKKGYFQTRDLLNNNKLDYRVLSLPGSNNYQVTVLNHDDNRYYRGLDPLMYSINKPFIAAYTSPTSNLDHIFTNFSNPLLEENLLNIYNIKHIVIDNDMHPAFGFREEENVKKLIKIFSAKNEEYRFNPIYLFGRTEFLPHFYVPKKITVSSEDPKNIVKWASVKKEIRSAIYYKAQNKGKNLETLRVKQDSNNQVLEFKKINPAKYRIVIHNASGEFPLIFSESFHPGWKIYVNPRPPQVIKDYNLTNYQILYGNNKEQANREEVQKFLKQGFLSTLGDGTEKKIIKKKWVEGREEYDFVQNYIIDFISKNFQDTIQNDNLLPGPDYETWFEKPIVDNENHIMTNGYANSCVLNTDKICNEHGQAVCIKNTNGTYDFEIVVEFWPQRLFYGGLLISGATLAISLVYLAGNLVKRRKGKQN